MNEYKVTWSYRVKDRKRNIWTDLITNAASAREAADVTREQHKTMPDVRIEFVETRRNVNGCKVWDREGGWTQ